jgi:hypothetical protein
MYIDKSQKEVIKDLIVRYISMDIYVYLHIYEFIYIRMYIYIYI